MSDHILQMELITKELFDVGHPLTDKIQATIIFNSLPLSLEHIITSLTHSEKKIVMSSLRVVLVLEEESMKRKKRENE